MFQPSDNGRQVDSQHQSCRRGSQAVRHVMIPNHPRSHGNRVASGTQQDCLLAAIPLDNRGRNLGRRTNAYIPGLSVEESESLLDTLWAHATRPENTWTHTWKVGDLLMWDNRCAMHRRDSFDDSARRIMHRTQIGGDRPFYDPPKATSTTA
ncbi:MAG: TauD/TfdA family dioxygenase [Pirellulaceae bacterium]|nr:TauD/TfdA family dioxygenase [Pirellulaceae bacterium]